MLLKYVKDETAVLTVSERKDRLFLHCKSSEDLTTQVTLISNPVILK